MIKKKRLLLPIILLFISISLFFVYEFISRSILENKIAKTLLFYQEKNYEKSIAMIETILENHTEHPEIPYLKSLLRTAKRRKLSFNYKDHVDLLYNSSFEFDSPATINGNGWDMTDNAGWVLENAIVTENFSQSGEYALLLRTGASATHTTVPVTPGKEYLLSFYCRSFPNHGTFSVDSRLHVFLSWMNGNGELISLSQSQVDVTDSFFKKQLTIISPLDSKYIKIRIANDTNISIIIDDVRLFEKGIRIESMKNGYEAAFCFTFDHETTMFRKINFISRIKRIIKEPLRHILPKYLSSGEKMRLGANFIKSVFNKYGIHGTWYVTGYALLLGNKQRKSFCNNPIYAHMSQTKGWTQELNWKSKTPIFSFDPFGTYRTHPGWYFGDQVKRFAYAGEDIQTHTFGHPYVAMYTPEGLDTDLAEWQAHAEKLGIPRAMSLAFPFGSFAVNSKTKGPISNMAYFSGNVPGALPQRISNEICHVLVKHDIKCLTRVRPPCFQLPYRINTVENYPQLDIYPDNFFDSTSQNIEKYLNYIEASIIHKGYSQLWLHPYEILSTHEKKNFELLTKYIWLRKNQGVLWVDTLKNIWQHARDIKNIEIEYDVCPTLITANITNNNDHQVTGVTISVPYKILSVKFNGLPYCNFNDNKIILPTLGVREKIDIKMTYSHWDL